MLNSTWSGTRFQSVLPLSLIYKWILNSYVLLHKFSCFWTKTRKNSIILAFKKIAQNPIQPHYSSISLPTLQKPSKPMIRSVVFNLSLKIARIIAIACHISHSLRSWRHNTGKANKYLLGSDISWDHVNVCRNMLQNILFIALLEFVFLDMNTKKVCIKCICQWKRCQKVESFYEWMNVDQVGSTKCTRVYFSPPWSWGGGVLPCISYMGIFRWEFYGF